MLFRSSVYIGTIAGGWLGGWFAEKGGWRNGFYLFGSMGIVLALVLYRFLREPVRGSSEAEVDARPGPGTATKSVPIGSAVRMVYAHPAVPLLVVVFMGANFVATIFLIWTPTFLVEKFGFRLSSAGFSGSFFIHAASACSVALGGWMADTLSQRFAGGRALVHLGEDQRSHVRRRDDR